MRRGIYYLIPLVSLRSTPPNRCRNQPNKKATGKGGLDRWLWICFGVVGAAKNVVGRYAVVVCQCQQVLQRQILVAPLVAGIDGLANAQQGGHIRLLQVSVLSQIPQPSKIHNATSAPLIGTIDFSIKIC